jgi:hypothetical protein
VLVGLAAVVGVTFLLGVVALLRTEGTLAYVVDDPAIHLGSSTRCSPRASMTVTAPRW